MYKQIGDGDGGGVLYVSSLNLRISIAERFLGNMVKNVRSSFLNYY